MTSYTNDVTDVLTLAGEFIHELVVLSLGPAGYVAFGREAGPHGAKFVLPVVEKFQMDVVRADIHFRRLDAMEQAKTITFFSSFSFSFSSIGIYNLVNTSLTKEPFKHNNVNLRNWEKDRKI